MTEGAVVAPSPKTLRIINGQEGKTATPIVKSRAVQLTDEEACATPDVVRGMFFIYCTLSLLIMLMFHVEMLRYVFSE